MLKLFYVIPITCLLFLIPYHVHASQEIQGKVVKVTDGDTVVIAPADGGAFIKCRLYGIDAPETAKRGEPGQPYGIESTNELKHMILAMDVQVVATGKDRYKRNICFIALADLDVTLRWPRGDMHGPSGNI